MASGRFPIHGAPSSTACEAMAAVHLMRFLSRWIANDVPLRVVCGRMELERDVMYFPLSA
eukprot:6422298-Pyramimonas_sp.AAC.1